MQDAPLDDRGNATEESGEGVNTDSGQQNIFGTEGSVADYFVAKSYRPGQEQALTKIKDAFEQGRKYVIYEGPTGAGKSHIARAFAFMSGKAHILTIQKMLQSQYERDFPDMAIVKGRSAYECKKADDTTCADAPCQMRKDYPKCPDCPYLVAVNEAKKAKVAVHNFDSFYYQTRFGKRFAGRELLIVDECFVGETPVMTECGIVPIKDVCVGDRVWSYDIDNSSFSLKRVDRKIEKTTATLCEVRLSNGENIRCTPNHEFLTTNGWIQAQSLNCGAEVMCHTRYNTGYGKEKKRTKTESKSSLQIFRNALQLLWRFFCVPGSKQDKQLQDSWGYLLFKGMRRFSAFGRFNREGSFGECASSIFRKDEEEQPHASIGSTRQSECYVEIEGLATACSGGKRKRVDRASEVIGGVFGLGNGVSGCNHERLTKSVRLSKLLQGRRGKQKVESSYRGRWGFSQFVEGARCRLKKNCSIGTIRVVSVTIQESGSTRGSEILRDKSTVYDLEVADFHNYVVSGVVVHNCHNIESKYGSFMTFFITSEDGFDVPEHTSLKAYDEFVKHAHKLLSNEYKNLESLYEDIGLDNRDYKRYLHLRTVLSKMDWYIRNRERDNPVEFVFDYKQTYKDTRVYFRPVLIGPFAKNTLFSYGTRVLMMSATILDKRIFCENVGLDPDEVEFIQTPSFFPPEHRYIIKKYAGKMTYKEIKGTLPHLIEKIEEILFKHPSNKGIIQTHTERIATYIKENITDTRLTFNKDFRTPEDMLEAHRHKDASIIVASGLREGLDLKGDLSRVQIFCKVPYPSLGDKWVKRRMDLDDEWYGYMTSLMLVQALGRSVRSSRDKAVSYILDSDFSRFYHINKQFIPDYIKRAIRGSKE